MTKNLYDVYGTEDELEIGGAWKTLGNARIKVARSGMKNTEYTKAFTKVKKKYADVDLEALEDKELAPIIAEIFVRGVIKAWEIKDDKGKWKSGMILLKDGVPVEVPVNVQNMKKCLVDLPDLHDELKKFAENRESFQTKDEEEDLKN